MNDPDDLMIILDETLKELCKMDRQKGRDTINGIWYTNDYERVRRLFNYGYRGQELLPSKR